MKYSANRILVITTRQIGDALLTTPLLRSLKMSYHHATIDVLTYQGIQGIFAGNKDIHEIITVPKKPKFSDYCCLLKKIYRRYDLAISTLTGDRPIFYAYLAGKKRLSIVEPSRKRDHWKRSLLNAWTELDDTKTHTVVQNLRLADLLAIPRVYRVEPPTSDKAAETIDKLLPFSWRSQAFVVMHLCPMWQYKRWTQAGWRDVAAFLLTQGYKIVLTGGNAQEELAYIAETFPQMLDGMVNLTGKLQFAEVARLISASRLFIGPDTAVTHIAAATATTTIALFGPTNPLKWAPWPANYAEGKTPFQKIGRYQRVNNVILLQGPGDCVPCHEEGCDRHKLSHSQCLENLTAAEVIAAIEQVSAI